MKQGTISVLFGCHSIIHSFLVLISWRKLYGTWPQFWQVVCIFLHDVGHVGLNYLDNFEHKKKHWMLGAHIGNKLFGLKAYYFLAGHCSYTGYWLSELYKPDKYSWYIAPRWWLLWNSIVEPKLNGTMGVCEAVTNFQDQVRASIESGEYRSTHSMYLQRLKSEGEGTIHDKTPTSTFREIQKKEQCMPEDAKKKTQAKSKMVISDKDAMEIASAIESKICALKSGHYNISDADCDIDAWVSHLEGLLKAIGPDGKNLITQ